MPYKPTGRPPGRPRNPRCPAIRDAVSKANGLDRWAHETRIRAAGLIASELASGKTQTELADALGWSVSELRRALRGRAITPSSQVRIPADAEGEQEK